MGTSALATAAVSAFSAAMNSASGRAPMQQAADGRRCTLPGGVLGTRGQRHRVVELRELTGADEEVLCGRFESGAQQVTALLARAIAHVEGYEGDVNEELIGAMLVGDRDYLLLRLRQMEVGDHVHQVIRCRARGCAKKVDVEFLISELPVRQLTALSAVYALPLSDDQGEKHVARLRLPTGTDLAAVANDIDSNPAAANTKLYARIVESIDGFAVGTDENLRNLPLRMRAQIAAFIGDTAPGPDLLIDVACPHCAADLAYDFDLHGFFLPSAL